MSDIQDIDFQSLENFLIEEVGYTFAIAKNILVSFELSNRIIKKVKELGKEIATLNVYENHDKPLTSIIKQASKGNDGLIIYNLTLLLAEAKDGDDHSKVKEILMELNYGRDVINKIGIPILFWFEENDLPLIANYAPDFYSQRAYLNIYFEQEPHVKPTEALEIDDFSISLDENILTDDNKRDAELRIELLEDQLKDAEELNWPIVQIVDDLVLPLGFEKIKLGKISEAEMTVDRFKDKFDQIQVPEVLLNISHLNLILERLDESKKFLDLAIKYAEKEDCLFEFRKYLICSIFAIRENNSSEAIRNLHQIEILFDKCNFQPSIFQSLFQMKLKIIFKLADLYYSSNSPEKVREYLDKAYQSLEIQNESLSTLMAKSKIKLVLGKMELYNDPKKAKQNLKLAKTFSDNLCKSYPSNVIITYMSSLSYFYLGLVEEYLSNHRNSLELLEIAYARAIFLSENNTANLKYEEHLANVCFYLGSFNNIDNPQIALQYFKQAKNIISEISASFPNDQKLKDKLQQISYVYEHNARLATSQPQSNQS